MFKKVLIAEDMDDTNKGVLTTLSEIGIATTDQVQYCDDAYLKIKKSLLDNAPYELLITDLSFEEDYREQRLTSGEALIGAAKHEQPDLKIIVYSVEDRIQKVRKLINIYQINAYICKGRAGLKELSKAIQAVYNNELFFSPKIAKALNKKHDLELDDYNLRLIKLLSEGLSQKDISRYLKNRDISPNSVSTIEKKTRKLREQFNVDNPTQLIFIAKDLGLI